MEVIVIDKDTLWKLYWEEGLTQEEIGKIYNKSYAWVSQQMKKYNILTRNSVDIKTRFLYHVIIPENLNDCWEWMGSKDKKGYGRFKLNRKIIKAHRASFILFHGEFTSTLDCLHKCDNPSCVNPDHLFIGNNQDNMNDMIQKGRSNKGENHGMSKLNTEQVKEIKELLLQGLSQIEIGKLFNISQGNISKIKYDEIWKHI